MSIAAPTTPAGPDGDLDPVVEDRLECDALVVDEVTAVLPPCAWTE